MKTVIICVGIALFLSACTSNAYKLSDYDKHQLEGFHANQANKMIDANEKNKKANQKAADEYRKNQNEQLTKLNQSRSKRAVQNDRIFKFY